MQLLELDDGRRIVEYARGHIESLYGGEKPLVPDDLKDFWTRKRGVFVTLKKHPSGALRGCIGYPEPALPFGLALEEAAESAAKKDPRFPPVIGEELTEIVLEVSVLTPPKLIDVGGSDQLLEEIKVGRDGLIAGKGYLRGLLLPQVPVEQGWSAKEFLEHTCMKAGLNRKDWLDSEVSFESFQAQIFSEKSPGGKVEKH